LLSNGILQRNAEGLILPKVYHGETTVDYNDLWKPGLGAIIGFLLAQFVDVAVLIWGRWRRSKLTIELMASNVIMAHTVMFSPTEEGREEVYAFVVRNVGKKIATGVRFQILNIRLRNRGLSEFANLSDVALSLKTYSDDEKRGRETITLVPKAAANIALARWRQDLGVVRPCAPSVFEYYDEMCANAVEYRFEVTVFDDSGDFATKHVTILPGSG